MPTLTAIERRVLGTLIEKSLTTPQNYPLSLNSLTNGCNQKSARDPETNYTENEVLETLQGLKRRSLATEFFGAGSRVSKWEEAFVANLGLSNEQAGVLAQVLELPAVEPLAQLLEDGVHRRSMRPGMGRWGEL